jgi:NADH-quinone oxidoreductase subunit M
MKELGGLAARMPVWATFMVFFVMASVGLPGLNGFVSEFLCLAGAFQASSAWGTQLWGSSGGFTGGQVPGATAGSLGPWYAAVAGVGMIVAAMYLLYMVGKVVWGPLVEPHGHGHGHGHSDEAGVSHGSDDHLPSDLTRREIGTLIPLAVACLALGVYPKPVMDALDAPIARTVGIVEKARSAPVVTPGRAHADANSMTNPDQTSGRTTR